MNADKPILSPRRIVQPLSPLNFSDQQKNNSSPRKFFDTINFTGRRGQDSNIQKTPDLSVLNEESQVSPLFPMKRRKCSSLGFIDTCC